MKSPFPGMDPYLEQHWLEVHHRITTYARDQIQKHLPRELRARINKRSFVESEGSSEYGGSHSFIRVIERPHDSETASWAERGIALAEPITIRTVRTMISQAFIEVVDLTSSDRVVTVIEFVSPNNKIAGQGRKLYLEKQRELIATEASLVEIDLSRAGRRHQKGRMSYIPRFYWATYMACVTRAWRGDEASIYPLPLTSPLPAIPIPLRQSDTEVWLELQPLIDQCYENGAYDTIDYHRPLNPPLAYADTAWTEELLQSKGLR
jgi:hypothetical protein